MQPCYTCRLQLQQTCRRSDCSPGWQIDARWVSRLCCKCSIRLNAFRAAPAYTSVHSIAKVLAHDGVHSEDKIKAAMGPIILEEFSEVHLHIVIMPC